MNPAHFLRISDGDRLIRLVKFVFFCTVIPLMTPAQNAVFTVSADRTEIGLDDMFELTFTLSNGSGAGFTPPPFRDFQVFSGPSSYTSTTIINGQVSQTQTYSYVLKPRRTGMIIIGSAKIKSGNRYLETTPLTLRVVPGSAPTSDLPVDQETQCFVRAEPLITEAYPGQQMALNYKVYRTVPIESASILEEPRYEGFFKEDLPDRERFSKEVILKGKRWLSQTMKRIALFPLQAGELTIEPITLRLNMATSDKGLLGFFGTVQPVNRQSNAATVVIKPLPEGAPPSFAGAVGQYHITTALAKSRGMIGDIFSLHLTVSGNGDPKRIQAPPLELPAGLEWYDTRIDGPHADATQDQIQYTKIFEYLIKAKAAGEYRITPVFSWFDPREKQYKTSQEPGFQLVVDQGDAMIAPESPESASQQSTNDIPGRVYIPLALGVLVLAGGLLLYRRNRKPAVVPESAAQTATAISRLSLAKEALRLDRTKEFYDAISKALFDAASERYKLSLADQSVENVKNSMEAAGAPPEWIHEVTSLLQECELALYAGRVIGDGSARESLLQRTEAMLQRWIS